MAGPTVGNDPKVASPPPGGVPPSPVKDSLQGAVYQLAMLEGRSVNDPELDAALQRYLAKNPPLAAELAKQAPGDAAKQLVILKNALREKHLLEVTPDNKIKSAKIDLEVGPFSVRLVTSDKKGAVPSGTDRVVTGGPPAAPPKAHTGPIVSLTKTLGPTIDALQKGDTAKAAEGFATALAGAETKEERSAIYQRAIVLCEKKGIPFETLEDALLKAQPKPSGDAAKDLSAQAVCKEELAAVKADLKEAERTGKTPAEVRMRYAINHGKAKVPAAALEKYGIDTEAFDEWRRTGKAPAGYQAMLDDFLKGGDQKLYGALIFMQTYGDAVADFRKATNDCSKEEAIAAKKAFAADARKTNGKWQALNDAYTDQTGKNSKKAKDDYDKAVASGKPQAELDKLKAARDKWQAEYTRASTVMDGVTDAQIKGAGGKEKASPELLKKAQYASARVADANGTLAGQKTDELTAEERADPAKAPPKEADLAVDAVAKSQALNAALRAKDPKAASWRKDPQLVASYTTAYEGAKVAYDGAVTARTAKADTVKPPQPLTADDTKVLGKQATVTLKLDTTYDVDIALTNELWAQGKITVEQYQAKLAELGKKSASVKNEVRGLIERSRLHTVEGAYDAEVVKKYEDDQKANDRAVSALTTEIEETKKSIAKLRMSLGPSARNVVEGLRRTGELYTTVDELEKRLKTLEARVPYARMGLDDSFQKSLDLRKKYTDAVKSGDTKKAAELNALILDEESKLLTGKQTYTERKAVYDKRHDPKTGLGVVAFDLGQQGAMRAAYREVYGVEGDEAQFVHVGKAMGDLAVARKVAAKAVSLDPKAPPLTDDEIKAHDVQVKAIDVEMGAMDVALAKQEKTRLGMIFDTGALNAPKYKYDLNRPDMLGKPVEVDLTLIGDWRDKRPISAKGVRDARQVHVDRDTSADVARYQGVLDEQREKDRARYITDNVGAAFTDKRNPVYKLEIDVRELSTTVNGYWSDDKNKGKVAFTAGTALAVGSTALVDSNPKDAALHFGTVKTMTKDVPELQRAQYLKTTGELATTALKTFNGASGLTAGEAGEGEAVAKAVEDIVLQPGVPGSVKKEWEEEKQKLEGSGDLLTLHLAELDEGGAKAKIKANVAVYDENRADIENGGVVMGQGVGRLKRATGEGDAVKDNEGTIDDATKRFKATSSAEFDAFQKLPYAKKVAYVAIMRSKSDPSYRASSLVWSKIAKDNTQGFAIDQVWHSTRATLSFTTGPFKSFKQAYDETKKARDVMVTVKDGDGKDVKISTFEPMASPEAAKKLRDREFSLEKNTKYWANPLNRIGAQLVDEGALYLVTLGGYAVISAARASAMGLRLARLASTGARLVSDARYIGQVARAGSFVLMNAERFNEAYKGVKMAMQMTRSGRIALGAGRFVYGVAHMKAIELVQHGAHKLAASYYGEDDWRTGLIDVAGRVTVYGMGGAIPGITAAENGMFGIGQSVVEEVVRDAWYKTDPIGFERMQKYIGLGFLFAQVGIGQAKEHFGTKQAANEAADLLAVHLVKNGIEVPTEFRARFVEMQMRYQSSQGEGMPSKAAYETHRTEVSKIFGESPGAKVAVEAYLAEHYHTAFMHEAGLSNVDWGHEGLSHGDLHAKIDKAASKMVELGLAKDLGEARIKVTDSVKQDIGAYAQARLEKLGDGPKSEKELAVMATYQKQLGDIVLRDAAAKRSVDGLASDVQVKAQPVIDGVIAEHLAGSEKAKNKDAILAELKAKGIDDPTVASQIADRALSFVAMQQAKLGSPPQVGTLSGRIAHEQAMLKLGVSSEAAHSIAVEQHAREVATQYGAQIGDKALAAKVVSVIETHTRSIEAGEITPQKIKDHQDALQKALMDEAGPHLDEGSARAIARAETSRLIRQEAPQRAGIEPGDSPLSAAKKYVAAHESFIAETGLDGEHASALRTTVANEAILRAGSDRIKADTPLSVQRTIMREAAIELGYDPALADHITISQAAARAQSRVSRAEGFEAMPQAKRAELFEQEFAKILEKESGFSSIEAKGILEAAKAKTLEAPQAGPPKVVAAPAPVLAPKAPPVATSADDKLRTDALLRGPYGERARVAMAALPDVLANGMTKQEAIATLGLIHATLGEAPPYAKRRIELALEQLVQTPRAANFDAVMSGLKHAQNVSKTDPMRGNTLTWDVLSTAAAAHEFQIANPGADLAKVGVDYRFHDDQLPTTTTWPEHAIVVGAGANAVALPVKVDLATRHTDGTVEATVYQANGSKKLQRVKESELLALEPREKGKPEAVQATVEVTRDQVREGYVLKTTELNGNKLSLVWDVTTKQFRMASSDAQRPTAHGVKAAGLEGVRIYEDFHAGFEGLPARVAKLSEGERTALQAEFFAKQGLTDASFAELPANQRKMQWEGFLHQKMDGVGKKGRTAEEQMLIMQVFNDRGSFADVEHFMLLQRAYFGDAPPAPEALLRWATADGFVQLCNETCGPSMLGQAAIHMSALEAVRLVAWGREGMLVGQLGWMHTINSGTTLRTDGGEKRAAGVSGGLIPYAPESPVAHVAAPQKGSTGAEVTGWLNEHVGPRIGASYEAHWANRATLKDLPTAADMTRLNDTLWSTVRPTPPKEGVFAMILWTKDGGSGAREATTGHWVSILGGKEGPGGERIYIVRDPWSGTTTEIPAKEMFRADGNGSVLGDKAFTSQIIVREAPEITRARDLLGRADRGGNVYSEMHRELTRISADPAKQSEASGLRRTLDEITRITDPSLMRDALAAAAWVGTDPRQHAIARILNDPAITLDQKRAALQTMSAVLAHGSRDIMPRLADASARSLLTPAEAEAAAGLLAYSGMRSELRAWFHTEFAAAQTPERIAEIARFLSNEAAALRAASAPAGLGAPKALAELPRGALLPPKKTAHEDAVADLAKARADLVLAEKAVAAAPDAAALQRAKDVQSEATARAQEAELVIALTTKPGGELDTAVRITRYGEEFWTVLSDGKPVTRPRSAVFATDLVLQGDGTFAPAGQVDPKKAPGVRTVAEVDVQTQYALFEATNGDGGDKLKQYEKRMAPKMPGNLGEMPVILVGPHVNVDTQAKLASKGVIVVRSTAEAVALHTTLRERSSGRSSGAKETSSTELLPLPTEANKALFASAPATLKETKPFTRDITLEMLDPKLYAYLQAKYAGDPKQLSIASSGAVTEILKLHFGKVSATGHGPELVAVLQKITDPAARAQLIREIVLAHSRGQLDAVLARWKGPKAVAGFGGPPGEAPTIPSPPPVSKSSAPPPSGVAPPTRELIDRVPKEMRLDFLSAWDSAGTNHALLDAAARSPNKTILKSLVDAYAKTPESHLDGLNKLLASRVEDLKRGDVHALSEVVTFTTAIPGFVDAKAHAAFMGPLLAAGRDPARANEFKERLKILDALSGPRPLERVTTLASIYEAKAGHPREALISPKLIKLIDAAVSVPRSLEPGATPLMSPHEAVRLTETLLSLDKMQVQTFFEACKGKTPEQITLLMKALTARSHKLTDKTELPNGLFVCDRAMAEIVEYAAWVGQQSHETLTAGGNLAGFKPQVVEIKDSTGKVIERRTVLVDGAGKQVYGTSCAATTAIMAAAEHDPYIAFLFRKDPQKMFDAQRALMYKEGASFDRDAAFVPIEYALAKAIIDNQATAIDSVLFDGSTLRPEQQAALKTWQSKRHDPQTVAPGSEAQKAMLLIAKMYEALRPEQKASLARDGVLSARDFLATLSLRDAGRDATGTMLGNQMRYAEARTGMHYEPTPVGKGFDLTTAEGISALVKAAREFGHVPISVTWGTDTGHALLLKGPVEIALPGEAAKLCFLIADPATGKAVAVPVEDIGKPDVVRGLGIGVGTINYVYVPSRIDPKDGKARPSLFDPRQPLTVLPHRRLAEAIDQPFEHLGDSPTIPAPPPAVGGFGGPTGAVAPSEVLKPEHDKRSARLPEGERPAFSETAAKVEAWVSEKYASANASEKERLKRIYTGTLDLMMSLPAKQRARAVEITLVMADSVSGKEPFRVWQSGAIYTQLIRENPAHAAAFDAYAALPKEARLAGGEGLRLAVLSGRGGSKAFIERFAKLSPADQAAAAKALEAIYISSNHVQQTLEQLPKERSPSARTVEEIARESASAAARIDLEQQLVALLTKQLDTGALGVPFTNGPYLRIAMASFALANAMTGDHAAAKKLFFGPPAKSAEEIDCLCRLLSQQKYLGQPHDLSVVQRYFDQAKAKGLLKHDPKNEETRLNALDTFVQSETLTFESKAALDKDAAKYMVDPKSKRKVLIDSPEGAKVAREIMEREIDAVDRKGHTFMGEGQRSAIHDFFGRSVSRRAFETMLCPTVPGYTVEITGIDVSYAAFSISAVIRDANGRAVGIINRSALKEDNGRGGEKLVWLNDSLHLDQDQHSAGIAKGIYAQTEAFLSIVAPGAETEIRLRANSTVGKYAWARMGYEFADAAQRKQVSDDFHHLTDKHLSHYPQAVRDRVNKAIDECKSPQDFASLRFFDGQGKEILITVPNSGEAKIDNTPVGKAFFLDMPSGGWDAVKFPGKAKDKTSKELSTDEVDAAW